MFPTDGLYRPDDMLKEGLAALKVTNGCGSADSKFDFVPDNLLGLAILAACQVHDWMYHVGKTFDDKELADRV